MFISQHKILAVFVVGVFVSISAWPHVSTSASPPEDVDKSVEGTDMIVIVHPIPPNGPGSPVKNSKCIEIPLTLKNLSTHAVPLGPIVLLPSNGNNIEPKACFEGKSREEMLAEIGGNVAETGLKATLGKVCQKFLPWFPCGPVIDTTSIWGKGAAEITKQWNKEEIIAEMVKRQLPMMVPSERPISGSLFFLNVPNIGNVRIVYQTQDGQQSLEVPITSGDSQLAQNTSERESQR